MEIKSALRVFNESEVQAVPGVVPRGQMVKPLAGNAQRPTERLTANMLTH